MVRNQFAFHYSPQHIRDQIAQLDDSDKVEIYLSPLSVNTFYQFSETIASSAMLNAVDENAADEASYAAALGKLLEEVIAVIGYFIIFCDGCLEYMMLTYLAKKKKWLDWDDVELLNLPRRNEPQIPYFVRNVKENA